MDAFVGKWNLVREKNEGITADYANAMGVSPDAFSQFQKMQFAITVAKADGGRYSYTYDIDGLPEPVVVGPFKLGEPFEFYDKCEKRTEERTFTAEGGKIVEKTSIKENPSCSWVSTRSVHQASMTLEIVCGGHTAKQHFAKS